MADALAYFLTWTTRGARLHGDSRGSFTRTRPSLGARHVEHAPGWERHERGTMRGDPILLDQRGREVVERAISDHAVHRGWTVLALSVRTNHVHVVVDCRVTGGALAPELVLREFKSWATRRMREAGIVGPKRLVWTRHGSTRWINRDKDVTAAIDYVARLQDVRR